MLNEQIYISKTGRRVLLMDSITTVGEGDENTIVVSASHGGVSSGEFAIRIPLVAVCFNDAGVGKEDAGIAGLEILQKRGIPGIAVSHESAQIGDGEDTWRHGVISHLNQAARDASFEISNKIQEAIVKFSDELPPLPNS